MDWIVPWIEWGQDFQGTLWIGLGKMTATPSFLICNQCRKVVRCSFKLDLTFVNF